MKHLDDIVKEHLQGLNDGSIKCEANNYCFWYDDSMVDFTKVNDVWMLKTS